MPAGITETSKKIQDSCNVIFDAEYTEAKLTWRDIDIQVLHKYNYSPSTIKSIGRTLIHIQVYSDEPISITETGYKSIFLFEDELEPYNNVMEYLMAYLDADAVSKKWKRQ